MDILLKIVPTESLTRDVIEKLVEKAQRLGLSPEGLVAWILKREAEAEAEEAERPAAA